MHWWRPSVKVLNDSPLPVVCFTHPRIESGAARGMAVLDRVLRRGRVWISHVKLDGRFALRACITSYRSKPGDVATLVEEVLAAL